MPWSGKFSADFAVSAAAAIVMASGLISRIAVRFGRAAVVEFDAREICLDQGRRAGAALRQHLTQFVECRVFEVQIRHYRAPCCAANFNGQGIIGRQLSSYV